MRIITTATFALAAVLTTNALAYDLQRSMGTSGSNGASFQRCSGSIKAIGRDKWKRTIIGLGGDEGLVYAELKLAEFSSTFAAFASVCAAAFDGCGSFSL
ncbi:hypothetical protein C8R31_10577 [Nitrosospira sp. Nsp2]|nr:hypothetical protein C8R31_10577 [Nitrosospira sp. Nsp2]